MEKKGKFKKGFITMLGTLRIGISLGAVELTYPKEGKGDRILGYKKLENSLGITESHEGNIVTVNSGGIPLERVFGATEDENSKAEVLKNNKVIVDGGILKSNGYWEENNIKEIRGGSVYGAAGQKSLVTDNTVIIKGNSEIGGNVYGGYTHRGSAINNKVILDGSPKFGVESTLFGGRGSRNTSMSEDKKTLAPLDVVTGNTLEVNTRNVTVKDVKNFEKYIFNINGDDIKENDKLLILTNEKGINLNKPEEVKVSSKLEVSEEEKNRIIKEKNKDIDIKIDVFLKNKPSKEIRNMKVVLINADKGISLSRLPKNIDRRENGYKYQVKFEKDSKNLYAIISVQK